MPSTYDNKKIFIFSSSFWFQTEVSNIFSVALFKVHMAISFIIRSIIENKNSHNLDAQQVMAIFY
jgi:hypothetical protein